MSYPQSPFAWHTPTAIEYGRGGLHRLPELARALGGTRLIIVADPGLIGAGIVDKAMAIAADAKLPAVSYTEIESDPDIAATERGTELAKASGADLVVGIGGGSALDTAKAIGLMLKLPGHIKDYVGLGKVPFPGAPVIAVPTTAGTGSELTVWSVLSDKANKVKLSVGSVHNCPRIALLDPELTLSLPASVTAATGMDALTHALESFVNSATQPISEAMSIQAMRMIARSLRRAVARGDDIDARSDMLLASAVAALAFNSTRLGIVHAFAIPLGARFGVPHGLANAIMLTPCMRWNLPGNLGKFVEIARIFGEKVDCLSEREAAERAVIAVESLKHDVGITQKLSAFGVREEHLDGLVAEAMTSGNVPVNPRRPTPADMKALLRLELE